MIQIQNKYGMVEVSDKYLTKLLSETVTSSFGVISMAKSSAKQGIKEQLNKNIPDKGVLVKMVDGELNIDLHIIVRYGVNIKAIVNSIVNRVTYTIENATTLAVSRVSVFINDIHA